MNENFHRMVNSIVEISRLITESENEGTEYITKYFDGGITKMEYDSVKKIFSSMASSRCGILVRGGTCDKCRIQHQIEGSNYCAACLECNSFSPNLPIDPAFTNLNNFQVNYNQVINGNVITNIYNPQQILKDFLDERFGITPDLFQTCKLEVHEGKTSYVVGTLEQHCPIKKRTHRSNYQYVVVNNCHARRKCNDIDCKDKHWTEIMFSEYPEELKNLILNVGGETEDSTNDTEEMKVIKQFLKNKYPLKLETINVKNYKIIIETRTKYCNFVNGLHSSSCQYVVMDLKGCQRKCHSSHCVSDFDTIIPFKRFPQELKAIVISHCTPSVEGDITESLRTAKKESSLGFLNFDTLVYLTNFSKTDDIISLKSTCRTLYVSMKLKPQHFLQVLNQDEKTDSYKLSILKHVKWDDTFLSYPNEKRTILFATKYSHKDTLRHLLTSVNLKYKWIDVLQMACRYGYLGTVEFILLSLTIPAYQLEKNIFLKCFEEALIASLSSVSSANNFNEIIDLFLDDPRTFKTDSSYQFSHIVIQQELRSYPVDLRRKLLSNANFYKYSHEMGYESESEEEL